MLKKIATVVLPTYNESENLRILVPRIMTESERISSHELHILVVDDQSPDGTADVARVLMRSYPQLHLSTGEKKGLGEAYKRGIAYALDQLQSDIIFQMDADFQHDPSLLPSFVKLINDGFTFVIGSRFAPGGSTPGFGLHRRMVSLLGTRLVRIFAGLPPLRDCTSGYRCIKADLLRECDLRGLATRGYSFQSSLLSELILHGARVIEVPIVFENRKNGRSKLGFRDQMEFVFNLFKLARKRIGARDHHR